jgi:hypothetical protein
MKLSNLGFFDLFPLQPRDEISVHHFLASARFPGLKLTFSLVGAHIRFVRG